MSETIFITGVSSGLGYALAKIYLNQGATVYGCSRRVPEDLIEQGLIFKSADLSDGVSASHAIGVLLEDAGDIHRIILNAGKLGQISDMSETMLADFRETMEVNMIANKWLLDLVFASGRQVRQVVAISTGASRSGHRGWNGYSISKAGLNMLIHMYAQERRTTHFSSLAPGLIDTAMQDYLTNLPEDDRFKPLAALKAAKGTDAMPDSETCAHQLIETFPKLIELPSGSYVDVRDL